MEKSSTTVYALPETQSEMRRLRQQHELHSEHTHALWRQAGLARGARVLDLGSGPGFAAAELAARVGRGGVVFALERSDSFTAALSALSSSAALDPNGGSIVPVSVDAAHTESATAALRSAIRSHLGESGGSAAKNADDRGVNDDGDDDDDDDDAFFDLVYVRWVFSWMSERDRAACLAVAHRFLRRGGRIAVMDYANNGTFSIQPPSAAFDACAKEIFADWEAKGGTPFAGSLLPAEMRRAGFGVDTVRSYCPVARSTDPMWLWPSGFFREHLPHLRDAGRITAEMADAFFEMWEERSRDPDAFYLAPLQFDIIATKTNTE